MASDGGRPICVLQVVGGMGRGGLETWLMHVLRHIDRERFHIDFLVHTSEKCAYDDEVHALGSRIIPCLHPRRPRVYGRNFRRALQEFGPYDVVHSHVYHYSGYVLRLASQAGVPRRIAHSHMDTSDLEAKAALPQRLYVALSRQWLKRYATSGLACSNRAAAALYGPDWQADPRWQVLLYGVDFAPFRVSVGRAALRGELGISPEAFVVGHVGRFERQKNHRLLLDIAYEVLKREPRTTFLLVGDGSLRREVELRAHDLGIRPSIIFLGTRADVPRLMAGAMDVFVFPSLFEGLGLVLIEAQAAGVPCVIAETVPPEADVVEGLTQRVSLAEPASAWAEAILTQWRAPPCVSQQDALTVLEKSPFNIRNSLRALEAIYSV